MNEAVSINTGQGVFHFTVSVAVLYLKIRDLATAFPHLLILHSTDDSPFKIRRTPFPIPPYPPVFYKIEFRSCHPWEQVTSEISPQTDSSRDARHIQDNVGHDIQHHS